MDRATRESLVPAEFRRATSLAERREQLGKHARVFDQPRWVSARKDVSGQMEDLRQRMRDLIGVMAHDSLWLEDLRTHASDASNVYKRLLMRFQNDNDSLMQDSNTLMTLSRETLSQLEGLHDISPPLIPWDQAYLHDIVDDLTKVLVAHEGGGPNEALVEEYVNQIGAQVRAYVQKNYVGGPTHTDIDAAVRKQVAELFVEEQLGGYRKSRRRRLSRAGRGSGGHRRRTTYRTGKTHRTRKTYRR